MRANQDKRSDNVTPEQNSGVTLLFLLLFLGMVVVQEYSHKSFVVCLKLPTTLCILHSGFISHSHLALMVYNRNYVEGCHLGSAC